MLRQMYKSLKRSSARVDLKGDFINRNAEKLLSVVSAETVMYKKFIDIYKYWENKSVATFKTT